MNRNGAFLALAAIGMACWISAISCRQDAQTPTRATAAPPTEELRELCRADIDAVLKTNLAEKVMGTNFNKARGVHLAKWNDAQELGLPEGAFLIGLCYCDKSGGGPNYKKGIDLIRKSAEAGLPWGMEFLAEAYQGGAGVEKNPTEAVKWCRKAAEAGNVRGMFNLGGCYYDGLGVARDYAQALKWYGKSAEAGDSEGMNKVGWIYNNGLGVSKDLAEALKWFRKSAEAGNSDGMGNLGIMYNKGWGVPKNYEEGLKWLRKSAEAGNSGAMCHVGIMYDNGRGVSKDRKEAVKWYRKSAEAGFPDGMRNLAAAYYNGSGVPKDYGEAMKWYRKAAEAGNADGMMNIGDMYLKGLGVAKDYSEALKWFRKSAEAGDASGMSNLAVMYAQGWGVPKDYVEAVKWDRKSAECGNAVGMKNLGAMYALGWGVPANQEEAVKWFRKSAESGNPEAMNCLGIMYVDGTGVTKDYSEALKWFRKSAEAGDGGGMIMLGDAYRHGHGIEKNTAEAIKWYRKVLETSDENPKKHARECLDELEEKSDIPDAARRQDEAAKALGVAKEIALDLGNKATMKLILIPSGNFTMGGSWSETGRSEDETPQHEVAITKPFYMGIFHVTRGQFAAFVADKGYKTDAEKDGWSFAWDGKKWNKVNGVTWKKPGIDQTEEHPVVCVSHNDAVAFCEWLSKKTGKTVKLPTEAQWEYACRAGTTTPFNTGDTIGTDQANYNGNTAYGDGKKGQDRQKTTPVGSSNKNAFGLGDMHGNAWQWCADWYGKDYYSASGNDRDPQGPKEGKDRVARGGGWSNPPEGCRSSVRGRSEPAFRNDSIGFRVVVLIGL